MKLHEHVELNYKEGKLVLEAKIAMFLLPMLDGVKAKIEAGEIDPIKGTNMDKEALLKAIEFIKAEVSK